MKKKSFFLTAVATLSLATATIAQTETWQKTYRNGSSDDLGYSITKTIDSCYLISGSIDYNIGNLFKIDKNGNILWSKSYIPNLNSMNYYTGYNSVIQNIDSTVLISGRFNNPTPGIPVVNSTSKLSKNGTILFSLKNTGSRIFKNSNNEFISFSGNNSVSKISNNGSVLWKKDFYNFQTGCVAKLSDGNIICVGSADYLATSRHLALMKLSNNGDTIWIKWRGNNSYSGQSVYSINNGGFIFTSGNSIFKCDNNGMVIFEKSINSTSSIGVTLSKIIPSIDGGSYVAGSITGQGAGGYDFFIMKMDSVGNTIWSKTYGSILDEVLYDLTIGFDNSLILIGNTNGFSSINNDIYIVKTDLNGNTSCNENISTLPIVTNSAYQFQSSYFIYNLATSQDTISNYLINNTTNNYTSNTICSNVGINENNTYNSGVMIFPNPTSDYIKINFGSLADLTGYKIKISNLLGQKVFQSDINQKTETIDLRTFGENGIYFVRIIDPQGNTVDIRKIVLQ
jgi:hypothetical protein